MPKQLDLNEVLTIVRAGGFNDLRGAVEGDELECKGQPYRLEDPHGKFELAKDVSAFANANGGALLIGVQTAKDPTLSADVIRKISGFAESLVNISQYKDVLKDWIYPNLQKLEIGWFRSVDDPGIGIVAIIVEKQDPLWRPYLITRTVEPAGKVSTVLFGYAERSLDRSTPIGTQQLHLLMRDGLRFGTGGLPAPSPLPTPAPTAAPAPTAQKEPLKAPISTERITREEISDRLQNRINSAIQAVKLPTRPVLALAATPSEPTELQGLFSSRDTPVVQLLERFKRLRPSGFGPEAGINSRIVEQGQARRAVIEGYKVLDIWDNGTIVAVASGGPDFLSWGSKAPDRLRINQLALIESIFLFVRFATDVLSNADPRPGTVLFVAALRCMTLERPAIIYPGPLSTFPHGEREAQGNGITFPISTPFDADPRKIAFKIVARIYRWFGLEENNIPYTEVDAGGEKIISPNLIINSAVR